ncbi:hypothetical protein INS49_011597 [Diaporthe citri]|uniref:uncharacterized protein n=1 Tax=Diaporthe citri TaxID=83186 RepID=UPI001C8190A0|nr:uncharacterized protein INS49_011597 [Diaporthe citri]KAG6360535.1 hypothetical protein INS49_011597 [Diaporthe citri]
MTTTTNKPASSAKDEVVHARPLGVYTGENEGKRRKSDADRRTAREFDLKQQQRASSLAQAFDRDGKIKVQVKDWQPEALSDGTYGSIAMKDLCDEFAHLASDIVQDFTGGK